MTSLGLHHWWVCPLALSISACGEGETKLIGAQRSFSGEATAESSGSGSATSAGGSGSTTPDCLVSGIPPNIDAPSFYSKYADANGMPVLASSAVSDEAVTQACLVIVRMLAKRADVAAAMIANGSRVAVIAREEGLNDLPELMNLSNDWQGTRGIGASVSQPLTVGTEENLLCEDDDVYHGEVILVHSFAHAMRALGIRNLEPDFDTRLEAAYEAALFAGKWTDAFASDSFPQYWAEGVQSWFNVNLAPPNAYHNEVNTRAELQSYDPELYAIISEYLPAVDSVLDCFRVLPD